MLGISLMFLVFGTLLSYEVSANWHARLVWGVHPDTEAAAKTATQTEDTRSPREVGVLADVSARASALGHGYVDDACWPSKTAVSCSWLVTGMLTSCPVCVSVSPAWCTGASRRPSSHTLSCSF